MVMAQDGGKSNDERELIALRHLRDTIRGMRYGTITVIVQDGIVVQIDRTEKTRLDYSRECFLGDGGGI
jgi:hypothetical protein